VQLAYEYPGRVWEKEHDEIVAKLIDHNTSEVSKLGAYLREVYDLPDPPRITHEE
jgi:hypothetical protein